MILIINGHPHRESYSNALADAYQQAAEKSEQVERLDLIDLDFSPILKYGYHQRTPHEPDLARAMDLLKRADHLVLIFPVWWGQMPALLKGFIDRVFLPGHFFTYHENGYTRDKLMRGKTARVIMTMDAPVWFDRWVYGRPAYRAVKQVVLNYCGYRSRVLALGDVKHRKPETLKKWLDKVARLARKEAQEVSVRVQKGKNLGTKLMTKTA
ncbi:MAG: NAD(P)H-dependent oxidoreductase [Bacteroidota bacterium]